MDPVRKKTLIHLIFSAWFLVLVSGCTARSNKDHLPSPTIEIPSPQPSVTVRPSSTNTAAPRHEPEFLFPSVTILNQNDGEGISVIGFFMNNTTEAVTQVEIRATLYFHSERTPVWKEVSLPYQHVLPAERVPFLVQFPGQPPPKSIIMEVVSFQVSGLKDATLGVEFTGRIHTPEDEIILYGWITNPDNDPVQIHHFHLLAGYSLEEPTAFISSSIYPFSIPPHQRSPFLFTLGNEQVQQSISFHPFIDATIIPEWTEPPFSLPQYPEITSDPQGNLLLRGIIHNTGEVSRWVSAEVAMLYQGQIVSLIRLNPPFPLGPGESRGFGLTNFPGWRTRLDELGGHPDDISIEFFYDPLGCSEFEGQVLHLTVEITGFESTGSTLLIKGSASNPSSRTLSLPSIQAEIRSTAGRLQTSSWNLLEKTITQGQSIPFVLGVRLPEGVKLSEMEIDVTGTAVYEEGFLPY
jgi:hypothetical protein